MKLNRNIQKFIDEAAAKADEIYWVSSPNPSHNEELLRESILALRDALILVKDALITIDTRPQM
jgi:hypothetical protein